LQYNRRPSPRIPRRATNACCRSRNLPACSQAACPAPSGASEECAS
jgi:hypothetical protein